MAGTVGGEPAPSLVRRRTGLGSLVAGPQTGATAGTASNVRDLEVGRLSAGGDPLTVLLNALPSVPAR